MQLLARMCECTDTDVEIKCQFIHTTTAAIIKQNTKGIHYMKRSLLYNDIHLFRTF